MTSGIEISYFTKDFYTYINSNGWLVQQAGLSDGDLGYVVTRDDKVFEVILTYDRQADRATSLEVRYPIGDKDSELLLEDILNHIEGADDILRTLDNTK